MERTAAEISGSLYSKKMVHVRDGRGLSQSSGEPEVWRKDVAVALLKVLSSEH